MVCLLGNYSRICLASDIPAICLVKVLRASLCSFMNRNLKLEIFEFYILHCKYQKNKDFSLLNSSTVLLIRHSVITTIFLMLQVVISVFISSTVRKEGYKTCKVPGFHL